MNFMRIILTVICLCTHVYGCGGLEPQKSKRTSQLSSEKIEFSSDQSSHELKLFGDSESDHSIDLEWSFGSNLDKVENFKLFRNSKLVIDLNGTTTDYVDSGLEPMTAYEYSLTAKMKGSDSVVKVNLKISTIGKTSGIELYAKLCASCHNTLEKSNKAGSSEKLIKYALENISAMSSITVSDLDIAKIAAALARKEDNNGNATTSSYLLPLGTRHYVASVFRNVFLPDIKIDNAQDTEIESIIVNKIQKSVGEYGGPCSMYDKDCLGVLFLPVTLSAQMTPAANAARRGFSISACEEILSKDRSILTILNHANLSAATTATADNVLKIYQLFNVLGSLSENSKNALVNLYNGAIKQGKNSLNAWRFTIYPICTSVGVDSL